MCNGVDMPGGQCGTGVDVPGGQCATGVDVPRGSMCHGGQCGTRFHLQRPRLDHKPELRKEQGSLSSLVMSSGSVVSLATTLQRVTTHTN